MRLINTYTRSFEEFIGQHIPGYAILSHTWEEDEVSYKDYVDGRQHGMKGYKKIDMTCRMAAEAQISYVWVDTCCIDKRSSAELTEAINSMFAWYERSLVCYAYLSDLPQGADLNLEMPKCRWFTRGWTLQELIAPKRVHFFDSHWIPRGLKSGMGLLLSKITGIDVHVLRHLRVVSEVCVAQRMSWAAHRQTTRIEDAAYCLLGIFNINMPLLYGEEQSAFRRLQQKIIASTSDLSILAWTNTPQQTFRTYCGVLAPSPALFSAAGSISRKPFEVFTGDYSIGNNGIKIRGLLHLEGRTGEHGCVYVLPLYCGSRGRGLGVRLRKVGKDMFLRSDPSSLYEYAGSLGTFAPTERYLLLECPPLWEPTMEGVQRTIIKPYFLDESIIRSRKHALSIVLASPNMSIHQDWGCFDAENNCFFTASSHSSDFAALHFSILLYPESGETYSIDCMLYAYRWAFSSLRVIRYHLINYSEYVKELSMIQAGFHEMETDPENLLYTLRMLHIPIASSFTFQIPSSDMKVEVSVHQDTGKNLSLCPVEFSSLNLSYRLVGAETYPSVQ